MRIKLFIANLFFTFVALAQPGKEAWHWYFGNRAKIDFNSGAPVGGIGIPTGFWYGGCASVSDVNTGQYLFSVGGTKIFNKNNVPMTNGYGIFGNSQNSQDLIVPKPDSSNIYYVFTPDRANLTSHGLTYSVVDMSLQGGLGQVTTKNKLLIPSPVTEKVTAARHCNGKDYWVITHLANSNAFKTYLINSTGLDTASVVSHIGTVHQFLHSYGSRYYEGIGYIKSSPNGSKLALGIQSDSIPVLEIFDFDNSTGIVSNPITINYPGMFGPYGVSFSPDNSKLYSIPYKNFAGDTAFLYQYDMSSGVPSTIIASQTLIYSGLHSGELCALQIAPDGKIYISRFGNDTMAVINNPNGLGAACNFQFNGIAFPGYGEEGLPNFIDANYAGIQINIPDVQQCNTFNITTLDAGVGYANYSWNTGASTQIISISNPGKYWVTITSIQGCTRTDTINAYLLNPIKSDTLACDTFHINVTEGGVLQYNWFDGSHLPIRNFTQSGNYYVDINYVSGCAIRDSIKVTVTPSPNINLGLDTSFCKGNLSLNATNPNSTYNWNTGETSPIINVTKSGIYWVKVIDINGCKDIDTLIVKPQLTTFDFAMPNIVTPNDDNINDIIDFGIYQFSSLQLEIYNRWGQKIFESSDPKAVWKPAVDDGTYFYTAQYKIDCGTDSQTKNLKGFLTVVK